MSFNTLDKRIAMGRIPQTSFLTPTAGAANAFVEQVVSEPDSAWWQVEPKKMNNKGQGTGNRFATDAWVEAWDSSLGYNFDASSQNLGRHLMAVLGSVVTSTQGTGFKHIFTPLDTKVSMQLPAYSFVEKLAEGSSGVDALFPSAVGESLDLSGDGLGRIKAAVQYRGSGEELSGSSIIWGTHVQGIQGSQNYFFNSQANVSIGGYPANSSPVAMGADLEAWKFSYKNTLAGDAGYRPGAPRYVVAGNPESGVMRNELLLQDSAIEFGFSVRLAASDPNRTKLKNQTPLEGSITLTGALISGTDYHALTIKFHLLKYSAVTRSVKDGIATIDITPEVLWSATDSGIVAVELVNNVTSYTV